MNIMLSVIYNYFVVFYCISMLQSDSDSEVTKDEQERRLKHISNVRKRTVSASFCFHSFIHNVPYYISLVLGFQNARMVNIIEFIGFHLNSHFLPAAPPKQNCRRCEVWLLLPNTNDCLEVPWPWSGEEGVVAQW